MRVALTHRVSAALVVALVVLLAALTWANSGTTSRGDPLVLHGHAPASVEFTLTVSTTGLRRTSGTVWLDLVTGALRATLAVPVLTAATEIDVREVGDRLFLTSPNLADAAGPVWYVQPVRWPSVRGLAPIVVAPRRALATLLAHATIARHGDVTTYEVRRRPVRLASVTAPGAPTSAGTLDVVVTAGAHGELTALWARMTSKSDATTVSLQVLSYHPSLVVSAPPPARATVPAGPLLGQLATSRVLGTLVLPATLIALVTPSKLG